MIKVRRHGEESDLVQTVVRATDTRSLILDAARRRLLADGYGGLSTRKVADEAGVPLSQLHYHFGSKQGLILALLDEENRRRLERQRRMYAEDAPLWLRYERACDFLEDDLDSGYVRVLQEMIAAMPSANFWADGMHSLPRWHAKRSSGMARSVHLPLKR
jgi:AcrR family transcriptional regulator